jgi:hypothetical protein
MPVALRRPLAAAAALLLAVVVLPTTAAAAGPDPAYRPPVDAAVAEPFRPPATPYGPGHRGLEYATGPGTPVRAAADGTVTFAGVVAGHRHVTVLHADGHRTTASFLRTVAVVAGQRVHQGDELGTTEDRLFFSARQGDAYLDPALLFEAGPPRVWLVPFDEPPGEGPSGERSAIRQLLGVGGALARGLGRAAAGAAGAAGAVGDAAGEVAGRVAALPGQAADWLDDHGAELLRTLAYYGPMLVPELRAALLTATAIEVLADAWLESRRPCTAEGTAVAPPPERRTVVLVAGLGSTSESGDVDDVDVGALGYEPADVVRLSYRGGITPGSPGRPAGVPVRSYTKADSQQDLHVVGTELADLVEGLAAAAPGVPIDVVAHSQGGLVARLGLAELERRGRADLVGHLATIATPHGGAPLATAARAIGTTPLGHVVLDQVGPHAGLDPHAPSAAQLSITGDLVHELEATPLPPNVDAISIAGRTDVLVPVQQTQLDGARSVVIPTSSPLAHSQLPGDRRTTRELALAWAGAPPTCRSLAHAVLDQAAGRVIAEVEDSAALIGLGASEP